MADEVADLWRSIVGSLRSHAPATAASIRPPATDAALSSVIAAFEKPLPADLLRWWQLADGMTRGVLDPLIPSIYTPIPLSEVLEIRQLSLSLDDVRDALLHGGPALVAHAERRQQHFAGHAVDAAIWRAEVNSTGHLTWKPEEVGSRH